MCLIRSYLGKELRKLYSLGYFIQASEPVNVNPVQLRVCHPYQPVIVRAAGCIDSVLGAQPQQILNWMITQSGLALP